MGKILLIAEYCKDIYITGSSKRLSPEAPVPVFVPETETTTEGMGGNVLNNINALKSENIEVDHIFFDTGVKERYIDSVSGYQMFRVDKNITPTAKIENININNYDIIVISDYNKGNITDELINIVSSHPLVVVDTKRTDLSIFGNAIIKINEKEYKALTNIYKGPLIVTLGKDGCKYNGYTYPTNYVNVMDVTGAGDTFLAAFAVKYLETKDMAKSLKYSNLASSIAVTKRGTSVVTKEDLAKLYK